MQEIEVSTLKEKPIKLAIIVSIILIGFFLLISLLLLLLINWHYKFICGIILGYLFSLIGFFALKFTNELVLLTYNKYWVGIGFLWRMLIYAIPIIISAIFPNIFSPITTAISVLTLHISFIISELILNIKKNSKKGNKNNHVK